MFNARQSAVLALMGAALAAPVAGCHRGPGARPPKPIQVRAGPGGVRGGARAGLGKASAIADAVQHAAHHPPAPVEPLALCPGTGDALAEARDLYDRERFALALSCSARACADAPDSAAAHAERAADLVALGRLDDARLAFARALALDPDHADALLGAADLYITRLPGSRDDDELALVYADRGLRLARHRKQAQLVGSFALEAAMAQNDLGRPKDALASAVEALRHGAPRDDAAYEKASALYELCRFADARALFTQLARVKSKEAFARYHLGLIAERAGDAAGAAAEMSAARKLDPRDFPPEVNVTRAEFAAMVRRQVAALPAKMRADLATVPLQVQDLPDLADLTANDPPLSPAILGLFRGPSLGERCDPGDVGPCRSIALYRKNLARVTVDKADLEQQVRVTLLHELGHLRGEDDSELAARGLE